MVYYPFNKYILFRQALEEKYDALKDQLLLEALMKQAGELEWKNLTERQRQLRLAELKKKERQLRREGTKHRKHYK